MHANFDELAKIILKITLALSSTAYIYIYIHTLSIYYIYTNCSIILSIVTSYTERMHLKHFFKSDYSFPAFLGIQYIRDSPDTFLMSFQKPCKNKVFICFNRPLAIYGNTYWRVFVFQTKVKLVSVKHFSE